MPEDPYPITGGPSEPQPTNERVGRPGPPTERRTWPMRMLLALILAVGALMLFAYGPWPRVGWGWVAFAAVLVAAIFFGLATLFGNRRSKTSERIS